MFGRSGNQELDGGELVGVVDTGDPVEAGMIQGLLEGGGIPSLVRPIGIDGPQIGVGLLPRGPQRVMVRAEHAEQARTLLADTRVEDDEEAWPATANAEYREDTSGRKPRGYGVIGAYARMYLWGFGAMVAAFGIFLLLRALS